MTKILLTGANGQVGHELRRTLPAIGTVTALDMPEIDFSDLDGLRAIVHELKPDIIVNAAAYTAVDKAEGDRATAFAINSDGPRVLAEAAKDLGAMLVHYSTDYVFDGNGTSARTESDPTAPLSVYGASKRAGEQAVEACPRHIILRTSWVVSAHGHNFIKTILRLAKERDSLKIVADQFGAPTTAGLLADLTAGILLQLAEASDDDPRWGLYHLVASGTTTWHGLARHVVSHSLELGLALKVSPEAVFPITTDEYPLPASRPANSRLDTSKVRETFSIDLPDWRVGVDDVVEKLAKEMHT